MAMHKGENPYIYGFHDRGGEAILIQDGQPKGWVLVTEAIGTEANDHGGSDYRSITDQGLGLIVRLNQSYGPNGTIPREARYLEFAQRVANFVRASQGANIWLIGNEMNFEREQPRKEGSDQAEPITPRRYARCYKMVRDAVHQVPGHKDDLVIVGAIGPWNAQTPYPADPEGQYAANQVPGAPNEYPYFGYFGDFIQYWRDILVAIGPNNCDGMAIHAYSHGYRPEMVFDETKMGPPFQHYHYNFYTYRDQMLAIPENMRHLPVYLTEANGDREPPAHKETWPYGNNGWIKSAYQEIDRWNSQSGNQQIRCVILFRWQIDPLGWSIDGKPDVQQDLREAMRRNYQWQQDAQPSRPHLPLKPIKEILPAPLITIPTEIGIKIQDIIANLLINPDQPAYTTRAETAIKRFILHHTATPANISVERIANYQVNNHNLPSISYHFCITASGDVFQTQPLTVVSKQAGQYSSDSVGICLIGNFTNSPPSDEQLGAAAALLAHLSRSLKLAADETTIIGYRDLVSTASPGATWFSWKAPLIAKAKELADIGEAIVTPATSEPKPASEPVTPQTSPYRVEYRNHSTPKTVTAGMDMTVNLVIRNAGSFDWVRSGQNMVRLGFRWFDAAGKWVQIPSQLDYRTPLPRDIRPNQSVNLRAQLRVPPESGNYHLQWDMVQEGVTWFSQQGDAGLVIDGIKVNPAPQLPPIATEPAQPAQPKDGLVIQNVIADLPTSTTVEGYQSRNRRAIQRFVIHHTATSPNVSLKRITDFQIQRQKRPGITYHFCVNTKGEIFQTQALETIASHAGKFSGDSVGVCLIGNFNSKTPTEKQIAAAAKLLAYLGDTLKLTITPRVLLGYSELASTDSPGKTWSSWKESLLAQAREAQAYKAPTTPEAPTKPTQPTPSDTQPSATPTSPAKPAKTIEHYLLLWRRSAGNWAEWEMVSALDYIGHFGPTVGFSINEAKTAKYVTIVGGTKGVPASAERTLRAAGCQVERLNGQTQEEVNQMLYDLVAANKRFQQLKP